jgi:hypothetical protein
MIAIAEISGADSIAAALRFAEENPGARLVPTYVSTGTEFGDFSQIERNVAFLRDELSRRDAALEGELLHGGDPALWRALNGRPAARLASLFGRWLPCVGCHLYLHVMRVPTARAASATTVISGARERHEGRTKANQMPEVLDAFADVLAHAGLTLALPVRRLASADEIGTLLGPRWPGGSPQLECVLSGNEQGIDGSCETSLPAGFIDEYIRPVGIAIVDEMDGGRRDWDGLVAELVARMVERRHS